MGKGAALFDMDHTITWENSGLSSVRFARQQGLVPAGHLITSIFKIILYRLSVLNIDDWYEKNMEILKGMTIQDMERFDRLWFDASMKRSIHKEALDLIQAHREEGLPVAIITNSPSFLVKPMADILEIPDIICTQVEIEDGMLTGRLVKPLCYGEGKKRYAREWADALGIDLSASFFYTDSFFDLPLLKAVGHPVVVNPDMRLKRAARASGWPVRTFRRESAF